MVFAVPQVSQRHLTRSRSALAAAVLALSAACAGEPEHPECQTHRCDAVAMAFEATDPIVEQVVNDMRAATGADVIVDPMGVAVIFEPVTLHPETGKRMCGYTDLRLSNSAILYQEIHIATEARDGCGTMWNVVAHEMIHSLAPFSEHTVDGLFAETSNDMQYFDADAVAVLCGSVECRVSP